MAMDREARLDAIRRELELQDRQLAEAMKPLARMGDTLLTVPQTWLDEMDRLVQPCRPSIAGIRA
jgi:hypothetical protein